MSKKIIAILVTALMFAFAGSSAIAGDVTTAYLELKSTSVTAISGSTLRARITLLDAAGNRATTIEGSPISEAVVSIESINFPAYVQFAVANATDATSSITGYATGAYAPTLTNASAQFAIKYPTGTDIKVGADQIKATVKHNTSSIATKQVPITIGTPTANAYVVRTGGISTLPKELEEIPAQQADKSTLHVAGDSVTLDVFSAYFDGSKYYFTKKLPSTSAGSVAISISSNPMGLFSGNGVTLTDGHGTVQVQIKDLMIPSILNMKRLMGGTPATIASTLTTCMTGITVNFKAYAPVTRSIGTSAFDVTATDSQLRIGYDQDLGYTGLLTATTQTDSSKFKPDAFNKLSVVGLPINALTSTASPAIYNFFQDNTPASIAPPDAYNFVASPLTAKPAGNQFTVPGYTGGQVYGAILGWDQYNNPAPFDGGNTVPFAFLDTNVTPVSGTYCTFALSSTIATFTTVANSPFVPFAFTSPGVTGVSGKVYFDDTVAPTSAIKNALQNIKTAAQAVTFNVKNWKQLGYGQGTTVVPAPTFSPAAGVDTFQVAKDSLNILTKGFGGDTLNLRTVANDGTKVGLNVKKSTVPTDTGTLTIPTDSRTTDNAEQDVAFFTKLLKSASNTLHMIIETSDKNATFVLAAPFGLTTAGIIPADPRDFSPSVVSSKVFEATVSLDNSVRGHDTVSIVNNNATPQINSQNTFTVTILDAFGNAYTSAVSGGQDGERLEDSGAVITVFKADGTTAYPGASGDVRSDAINVSFDPSKVTAADSSAIVRITAGAATKDITLNLSALQATALKNVFVPILGIDTPVSVNFASQVGAPFTPITMTAVTTGSPSPGYYGAFPASLEAEDGLINSVTKLSPYITGLAPIYTFNAKPNSGKTVMTITADGRDAEATSTTLTLTFGPVDTVPPEIGAVTASACSISVACTDNVALNLAGSTVKVLDSTGKDITSTLPAPTLTGDGTAAGSISFTDVKIGLYTLDIVLKDKAGNITAGQKPANVTTCAVAACKTVNPAYAVKGSTLDVTITGENTNFGATSVVTFSDAAITVNSSTANSKTEIVANITISATAVAAKSDVTVTTGFETITCPQAFEVREQITIPSCVSVSPSTVDAGTTEDVTITLKDINLTGVTGIQVSFGCTGVTVNSATANSATTVEAHITVADTAQNCTGDVTVSGSGSLAVVCKSAFTVKAKVVPPVCSLNVSPSPVRNGIILPRIRTLTLTGTNSAWTSSSTVTIEGINTIIPLSRSANKISVLVIIPSKLRLVAGTKNVTVTTGTVQCKGTLVIQ